MADGTWLRWLTDTLRSVGRNARLAVFGRQRPRRAVRDAVEGAATELDPSESDVRAVGPEDGPRETPDPGSPEGRQSHDQDHVHLSRD